MIIDIINVIMGYLPIDDIYKIRDSLTSIESRDSLDGYIDKICLKRVLDRLHELRLSNEFLSALRESKGIISGSFILQGLLNEKWSESDIDIFVKGGKRGVFTPVED